MDLKKDNLELELNDRADNSNDQAESPNSQAEKSVVIKSLFFKFLERAGYQGIAFISEGYGLDHVSLAAELGVPVDLKGHGAVGVSFEELLHNDEALVVRSGDRNGSTDNDLDLCAGEAVRIICAALRAERPTLETCSTCTPGSLSAPLK